MLREEKHVGQAHGGPVATQLRVKRRRFTHIYVFLLYYQHCSERYEALHYSGFRIIFHPTLLLSSFTHINVYTAPENSTFKASIYSLQQKHWIPAKVGSLLHLVVVCKR